MRFRYTPFTVNIGILDICLALKGTKSPWKYRAIAVSNDYG